MDVTESSGNGEFITHLHQLFISVGHFFRLGIETGAVDVCVIDAVFLTAGDAQLNLQRHAHFAHPFQVSPANFNIFFQRLFGQIEHMRAEERNAVLFIKRFAGIQHAVHPGQQLFGGVVGVQDDASAV